MDENNYSWHHIVVVVVVVVWSALEWLTNTKREKGEKRKKKNCRLLKQSLLSFSFRVQVHSGSTVQYTSAVWRTVSGQRRRLWGNFALPPSLPFHWCCPARAVAVLCVLHYIWSLQLICICTAAFFFSAVGRLQGRITSLVLCCVLLCLFHRQDIWSPIMWPVGLLLLLHILFNMSTHIRHTKSV